MAIKLSRFGKHFTCSTRAPELFGKSFFNLWSLLEGQLARKLGTWANETTTKQK